MRSEIAFDELSLKKYESNDAQELFMLTGKNRDYLRKTLNWLDNVKSVDDSLSFISNCIEKDLLGYFIYYRKSMIGIVGLVESDTTNNNAEIGYWVDKDMQGCGVVTWALQTFVSKLFGQENIQTLVIKSLPGNLGSIKVAENCGFKIVEGENDTIDLNGQIQELLVYKRALVDNMNI